MRFHLGSIPLSPDFAPDETWKALREPSPWLIQLIALPIGVVVASAIIYLWFYSTPLQELFFPETLWSFLLSVAGIIVGHELMHAVVHPRVGRSQDSILGVWPSRLLFYAHFDGELPRNRFITILLMPLLAISILPLLVSASMQVASEWVAFASAFNALLACVDILGAGMVLIQIPESATVRNQGWRTYWRKHEPLAA